MEVSKQCVSLKCVAASFVVGGLVSAGIAALVASKLGNHKSAPPAGEPTQETESDMVCRATMGPDACYPE